MDPDLSRVIEETVSEIILEDTIDKAAEESIVVIIIGMMAIIEVGIGLERDHSQETIVVTELEVQVIEDQGQNPEPVLIGDGIRCYNCREYDHFARDCPTSREERD